MQTKTPLPQKTSSAHRTLKTAAAVRKGESRGSVNVPTAHRAYQLFINGEPHAPHPAQESAQGLRKTLEWNSSITSQLKQAGPLQPLQGELSLHLRFVLARGAKSLPATELQRLALITINSLEGELWKDEDAQLIQMNFSLHQGRQTGCHVLLVPAQRGTYGSNNTLSMNMNPITQTKDNAPLLGAE